MHKIWKEKNAHPESEKRQRGDNHIQKRNSKCFGKFYSKVYAETQLGEEAQESQNMETKTNREKKSCSEDVKNEIPEFTQEEVQAAIDKLKKR